MQTMLCYFGERCNDAMNLCPTHSEFTVSVDQCARLDKQITLPVWRLFPGVEFGKLRLNLLGESDIWMPLVLANECVDLAGG